MRETIERLNDGWNEAFNGGDAEAVAALYTEDAYLSPGNGQTLTGRSEIQGLFQSFIDNGVQNHGIEILDFGGNDSVLYEVAKWSAEGSEQDGQRPSFGGILTIVFERQSSDSWLTRTHVWNAHE